MRISVFVSVSLDLISGIPSVILIAVFQHLHKVALKLFVILYSPLGCCVIDHLSENLYLRCIAYLGVSAAYL